MAKKISIKQILLVILMFISLIVLLPKEQIFAYPGGPLLVKDTENDEMDATKWKQVKGGISYAKSGWIIQLVDDSGHPVLGSKTAYYGFGGANPPTSEPVAWFGETPNVVFSGTLPNKVAFLEDSQSNVPAGSAELAIQLEKIDASGTQEAHKVILNDLGVNKEAFIQYVASGKPLYLQLTGVYWCKQPSGQSFTGADIAGNTYQMAQHIPMSGTRVSGVAHKGAPNCAWLSSPKWGISNTSGTSTLIDAGQIKALGLGVGDLLVTDDYQVVICIENKKTGAWTTTYMSTGLDYTVLNPYQGATFVEGCVNTKKTKEQSASSTYTAVRTNVETGGQETRSAGVGAFKFNSSAEEHALFLHYITDTVIEIKQDTDLFAWELGYRMPHAGADGHTEIRTKPDTQDYGVVLNNEIYKWQLSTKPATPGGSDTVKYQWVIKDRSKEHTYTMSGSQGDFTKAIWNLYRSGAPHFDLWDKYNEALGHKIWNGEDSVDPKFSYYLMRSQLEGLALRPAPSSGLSSMLVAGKASFEDNWKDIGKGASQSPDSNKTWTDVCTYKFSYTAKIKTPTKGAWIIWKLQKSTRYWVSASGTAGQPGYVGAHWSSWSAWSDVGTEKEFKKSTFSPSKWNGTYASYNIDKYKVQSTGTGSSETAGSQTVSNGGTDGLDIDGKLASQIGKGTGDTLASKWGSSEIHNAATSSSQFRNNIYNLYGEIEMIYWKNADSELYSPSLTAVNTYVMSEYERHIIPPLVHGFKTSVIGGTMTGIGSLTTPATGKTASEVKSAANPSMGVTYMGTGFNVATTSKYRIDFGTAGLTISDNDEGANAAWKNKATQVQSRHTMYMSSVLSGVAEEIIMEFTFKPSGQKVYYTLLTSYNNDYSKTTQQIGKDDVSFKQGNASGGNASAIDPYTAGGVEGYLALTNMFDGTMISENESYAGQSNSSGPAHESALAAHSGQYSHISYSNWYDEESNHRFCIEKYHSWVIFDYVQAEDKIDYNLLTQNVASKYLNQSKYITVKFYTRLYRNNVDYTDGLYSWPGAPTLRVDKIKNETGGDLSFAIINQSTEDMKKN